MRKIIIKFIAFLLIIATLLPLAAACKKDPPPNNDDDGENDNGEPGGTENGGTLDEPKTHVTLTQKGQNELLLVDFASEEMAQINRDFKENQTYNSERGKNVYVWDSSKKSNITFSFTGATDVSDYQFVEFYI